MDILANYGTVLIIVAAIFGFMMAIGIGANDVANAMGTSVGSKALTVKQAIIIAMIFEFAGAYLKQLGMLCSINQTITLIKNICL